MFFRLCLFVFLISSFSPLLFFNIFLFLTFFSIVFHLYVSFLQCYFISVCLSVCFLVLFSFSKFLFKYSYGLIFYFLLLTLSSPLSISLSLSASLLYVTFRVGERKWSLFTFDQVWIIRDANSIKSLKLTKFSIFASLYNREPASRR